jgi:hypothetical protein
MVKRTRTRTEHEEIHAAAAAAVVRSHHSGNLHRRPAAAVAAAASVRDSVVLGVVAVLDAVLDNEVP